MIIKESISNEMIDFEQYLTLISYIKLETHSLFVFVKRIKSTHFNTLLLPLYPLATNILSAMC